MLKNIGVRKSKDKRECSICVELYLMSFLFELRVVFCLSGISGFPRISWFYGVSDCSESL